ncbi:transducin family protein / WD-40 repeat family protein, partial [Prunus dulcis]
KFNWARPRPDPVVSSGKCRRVRELGSFETPVDPREREKRERMGIFEPFRAIGYTTSSVPFSVQRLGTETFVTVSVARPSKFTTAQSSVWSLLKKIRALASYRDYTFAAYGNDIAVFKRAHQVATWSSHNAKVNSLLLFGEHILSVDIEGNLFIWAFKGIDQNLSPVGHITLENNFSPSCIMHPDTYLNKSRRSSTTLEYQHKEKLYEFKGWKSSICSFVSSPALDVVAVGCADGKIHVHNIRYDEELVTFAHSTRGAVTALSFSTDGQPLLASGGSSGVISIWNLEKRRLQSVIRDAHDGSILSLHFFVNEPVLMSSSSDNSIKMWILTQVMEILVFYALEVVIVLLHDASGFMQMETHSICWSGSCLSPFLCNPGSTK